jgi:hypothetical protein
MHYCVSTTKAKRHLTTSVVMFFNLSRNHAWLCFHNESIATLGRICRGVFNRRRNHAWLNFHNESIPTLGRIGRGVFLPSWKSYMIVFPQRKHSDMRPHRSWCFFYLRGNHAWLCFDNESIATLGRIGRGVFFSFVEIMHYCVSTTKAKRHWAASVVVFF